MIERFIGTPGPVSGEALVVDSLLDGFGVCVGCEERRLVDRRTAASENGNRSEFVRLGRILLALRAASAAARRLGVLPDMRITRRMAADLCADSRRLIEESRRLAAVATTLRTAAAAQRSR